MRKSWIGFGAITGIAATVAVVPYFIDWNWFKPRLVAAVEEATGYEVEVAGDIGFSLLPAPRLSAEGLKVIGFGAAKTPLATAGKLSAAVAFLPLLSKKAEVKYIVLESPTVRIVDYADGTNNWSNPAETAGPGGTLSIEDFRIEDGTFISQTARGGVMRIDDINVALEVASADGPYSLEGNLRYGALPLEIKAGLKPGGGVTVDANIDDAGTLSFAGRVGEARGGAATPVAGRLTVEGETLGKLLAAFSPDDKAGTAAAYEAPVKLSATVRGTTERLSIGDIRGELANGGVGGDISIALGDRTAITGRLTLARLDIADWLPDDDDDTEPFELPKDTDADVLVRVASLSNGDMRFGAVNAPVKLANSVLTVGRTSASLPGGGVAVIAGTLDAASGKPRFRGRFEMKLPRPASTLAAMGSDGYSRLPPLTLAGGVVYAGDVVTLSGLSGAFDGGPVAGQVRYPLADGAPIDVTASAATLNMDRLVSNPAGKGADREARPIRFNVRLGRLVSSGTAYGGISASGRYAGDTVTLSQAVVKDAFGFGVTAKGSVERMSGDRRADLALGLAGEGVKGAITVKGPMSKLAVGGTVTYAGAAIGLDGWVRTDPDTAYELTASARAPEAGVVLAKLRDEARAARIGPLDLAMRIVGAGDNVKISGISGNVGGMTLSGDASVNTAGAVPRVNAVLKAGAVPVTALLGDDGTGAAEAVRGGERWSSEPMSFDWIKRFDGRIAMTADRALYDTYVLDKPSLEVVSRGGALTIERMKAGMYGGDLSATGTLQSGADQRLALKLSLNDVPMEPLLKAVSASAPATGMLDMTANVTARGTSQRALMASMAGPVRIAASNGVIRKVDLARLDEQLGDLRSVNSLVRFAGAALKGGETRYRMLAADLSGSGGRFAIDKVTTDMDGGGATAKGYVDLGAYHADIDAVLRLGSHDDAPAIPASIKGDLPTPAVNYSLGPLQAWFGKRLALVGLKAATGGDKLDLGGLLGVKKPGTTGVNEAAPTPAEGATVQPKTVEEELGGALSEGIGQLFGKKTKPAPPPPSPTEEQPLEPANLGDPN